MHKEVIVLTKGWLKAVITPSHVQMKPTEKGWSIIFFFNCEQDW